MSARWWIRVDGPCATGPFGSDAYYLNSLDDFVEREDGYLSILDAEREPRERLDRNGGVQRYPGRPERLVIYPPGAWSKVTVQAVSNPGGAE